jgi:hypothetical protein
MPVPQGNNVSFNIFRGFNKNSPISIVGNPIAATGYLKQNVELGRFGFHPDGLYWTTAIDVIVGTDARDAWNSFLNSMTSANADTVLVQDYPIPGWCTPFMVVMVERLSRGGPSDRYRLYLDRCQPVQGACPTSGGVTVPCCSNALPNTIHMTISDSGSCGCLDGTYALTWNPTYTGGFVFQPGAWVLQTTLCSTALTLAVFCNPSIPGFVIGLPQTPGGSFGSQATGTCSPFSLQASLNLNFASIPGCSGSITMVVTT